LIRDQDIDLELPSDVDDDFVTTAVYLLSLPGEPTKMLIFVSLIKLGRILSNMLETLYTTTDRRRCATKIENIHRQLDQWHFTLPEHLQIRHVPTTPDVDEEADAPDIIDAPILYLHLLFLYIRIAAHRVALSFPESSPFFRKSLLQSMVASKQLIEVVHRHKNHLLVFETNPGAYNYTLWTSGLIMIFGLNEFREATRATMPASLKLAIDHALSTTRTCCKVLDFLASCGLYGAKARAENLRALMEGQLPEPRNSVETEATSDTTQPSSRPRVAEGLVQQLGEMYPYPPRNLFQQVRGVSAMNTNALSTVPYDNGSTDPRVEPESNNITPSTYEMLGIWNDPIFDFDTTQEQFGMSEVTGFESLGFSGTDLSWISSYEGAGKRRRMDA
jgi:hypothetical protein